MWFSFVDCWLQLLIIFGPFKACTVLCFFRTEPVVICSLTYSISSCIYCPRAWHVQKFLQYAFCAWLDYEVVAKEQDVPISPSLFLSLPLYQGFYPFCVHIQKDFAQYDTQGPIWLVSFPHVEAPPMYRLVLFGSLVVLSAWSCSQFHFNYLFYYVLQHGSWYRAVSWFQVVYCRVLQLLSVFHVSVNGSLWARFILKLKLGVAVIIHARMFNKNPFSFFSCAWQYCYRYIACRVFWDALLVHCDDFCSDPVFFQVFYTTTLISQTAEEHTLHICIYSRFVHYSTILASPSFSFPALHDLLHSRFKVHIDVDFAYLGLQSLVWMCAEVLHERGWPQLGPVWCCFNFHGGYHGYFVQLPQPVLLSLFPEFSSTRYSLNRCRPVASSVPVQNALWLPSSLTFVVSHGFSTTCLFLWKLFQALGRLGFCFLHQS